MGSANTNSEAKSKIAWPIYTFIGVVGFTVAFSMFRFAQGVIDPLYFAFLAIGTACLLHLSAALFRCFKHGVPMRFDPKKIVLGLFCGACVASNDVNYFLSFVAGGQVSIVTPYFSTLAIALSVIFGVLILREGLTQKHIIGLFCAVIGVVLLNV